VKMTLRHLLAAFAVLFPVAAISQETPTAQPSDPAPEVVEVMVLGLYHFDNPGSDVVNMEVDDVLAPRRQSEIAVLVDALAEWQPTKIAVENQAEAPELVMEGYARTEELLTTSRNETVQIGYRLARQLGHTDVYGYDERAGEGEPDYFPMGKVQQFAAENDQMDILQTLIAEVQAESAQQQAELPNQTVAQSLLSHNNSSNIVAKHDRLYYSLLRIGNGDAQPGAELNAYWYMRNAKMFAKIDMIAEPGDRVLVLAGSGHATWLRHFAERMPGFRLVESLPFIERAAASETD
jgi:hypothetical protein